MSKPEEDQSMTYAVIEQRVGTLEASVGGIQAEQARQGERQNQMQTELHKVNAGIDKLLERDARRGQAWDFKTAATVCAGLAAIAYVVWWLIATSPIIEEIKGKIRELENRILKLDDPEIGKVTKLQEELRWKPQIKK